MSATSSGELWIVRCVLTTSAEDSGRLVHVARFVGKAPDVQVTVQSEHALPYMAGGEYILELSPEEVL